MAHVLALDLSIRSTGYAILNDNELLDYGCFKPPIKLKTFRKIEYNLCKLKEVLDKHARVRLVVIESAAFAAKGPAREKLAEQQGVIKHWLIAHGYMVAMAPITAVKKAITGNGGASKEEMVDAINEQYEMELSVKQNDIADAIAIGTWAMDTGGLALVE